MNVYFIRHTEAENKTVNVNDSERELTSKGMEQMILAVNGWKKNISGFDKIISSPFRRAFQTAQIVKKILDIPDKIITDRRLEPASNIDDIIQIAVEHEAENIAFVGHEPDISLHISALVSSSGATIDVKKGAIAKISFHGKREYLVVFLSF